jgi:hypothetical protein
MPNVHSKDLVEQLTTLPVRLPDGGTIILKYRPAVFTPQFLDRMAKESNHVMLSNLIAEWDLTVYKNWLDWLLAEVERKMEISRTYKELNELASSPENHARHKELVDRLYELDMAEVAEPTPDPDSGEVPYPLTPEALSGLRMRWVNTLASAIVADQVPNRRRDDDEFEGSF